jgi:hypothetical protein
MFNKKTTFLASMHRCVTLPASRLQSSYAIKIMAPLNFGKITPIKIINSSPKRNKDSLKIIALYRTSDVSINTGITLLVIQ